MEHPRDTVKVIIVHKITSFLIGVMVVASFGIPFSANITIATVITILTLIKDYYLRRYFNRRIKNALR